MRRFSLSGIDISDISLRLLANIADVFVIYTVFALIRWYLFRPMYIHIAYFLTFAAAAAIMVRYIEKRNMDEKRQRFAVIASGIAGSLVFALVSGMEYGAGDTAVVFIIFLILWGRTVKSTFTDLYGIFNVDNFYWGLALIGASDILIYMLKLVEKQKDIVSSCAVLYIVISMYLLSTLKTRILYMSDSVEKRGSFDLLATVITLAVALVFSSKGAMHAVGFLLGYVQKAVVWLVGLVAIPIGYLAVFILDKIRFIFEAFWKGQINDASEQSQEMARLNNTTNYVFINNLAHFIAYAVLAILAIAAVYYIYKAMDRYLGKANVKDYEESREFIVGFGQLKENLPKSLGTLKNIYNAAVDRLLFNIRASTSEKMRFEYKKFIRLLYSKELTAEEHTAANICSIIGGKYPQVDEFITDITKKYEDIRYGGKEPSKAELDTFKEYLGKVISVIG